MASRNASYDFLIKLLLIGDSGQSHHRDHEWRRKAWRSSADGVITMLAIAAMLVWRGECGEWMDGDCSGGVAAVRSASLFLFGHVDRRGGPSSDARLLLARQMLAPTTQ